MWSDWILHLADGTEAHIYYPAKSGEDVRRFYDLVCPGVGIVVVEKDRQPERSFKNVATALCSVCGVAGWWLCNVIAA